MREAYSLASSVSQRERKRKHLIWQKNAWGIWKLSPGIRVLIRKKEDLEKLRPFWEKQVYVVTQKKYPDSPVYEIRPEDGKGRTRTLHRNLLLPWDYLRVEKEHLSGRPVKETRNRVRKTPVRWNQADCDSSDGEEDWRSLVGGPIDRVSLNDNRHLR